MTTLIIYNLHPLVTIRDLYDLLENYGEILGIVLYEYPTEKIAKIDFKYHHDASIARHELNHTYLDDRELIIDYRK